MIKRFLVFSFVLFSYLANAQTFTFACMDSTQLTGINCDVCPVTNITSRSFCGLLIYKSGVPFKWIDQPYTARQKPGNSVEYLEQIPSIAGIQTQDRVTISLSGTSFFTVQGMIDSTVCHCSTGEGPLWYASDSLNLAPINKGDTLTIVGRDLAHVTFDSLLQKYVIQVDSVSSGSGIDTVKITAPAAGFTVSGSPGVAPTASFVFTLANDLAALEALTGTGIPARTGVDTWALRTITAGTGISVSNGDGVSGNPTITNSAPDQTVSITGAGISVVTGTYPAFTVTSTEVDGSTTNEIQTYGHAGTTTYTNTLSLGGGSWSITGAGIAAISNTAGAITVTATEAQVGNNGLSDNEGGGGMFRLGNGFMNGSDGLFGGNRKVNVNAFKLYIGDNTDSTLMMIDGTNDRVGIHTTIADTKLHVNGNMKVTDLGSVTPTRLVGADGNGIFAELFLGSGLSISAGTLNVSAAGFYQTLRDDGVNKTQRSAANFVSTARISTLLTDDAINDETEVALDIVANSIGNTHIRQGVARSVIGVTGNATANVSDIQSGAADAVLVTNGTNSGISFSTVATGGITNSAVTYAKIQNMNTLRVLGRTTAGVGIVQELGSAALYTILGLSYTSGVGVANRFVLWTPTNTLSSNAAYTFDGANGRATFTPTVAGLGAGLAGLNISTGALGSMEFLQMRGAIAGNLIAGQYNTNNALSTAHSFYTISSGGASAGDAFNQYVISGVMTSSFGIDNSDGDKMKLTTNSTTPGGNVNASFVATNDALPKYGFNKDNPNNIVDISGKCRATQFSGHANDWVVGNFTAGTALAGGGSITAVTGTANGVKVSFSTGTAPTANGDIFVVTYPLSFIFDSYITFSSSSKTFTDEGNKFYKTNPSNTGFTFKSSGTLTASTSFTVDFIIFGSDNN